MVYLILLGLIFIAQLFTVSWYIMTEQLGGKTKALPLKILCSGMFIAVAVLCAAIKDRFDSPYFLFFIGGLAACFIGDIFLNLSRKSTFTVGIMFFLCGHAFFACAVSRALTNSFGIGFFNIIDIAVWAVSVAGFAALTFNKKLFSFDGMRIPVIMYCAVIMIMAVKAWHLGILMQLSGNGDNQSLSFTLIVGSAFFVISDIILLMMCFGNKNTKKNSLLNAYFYYFGQMILACSILFIGG